MHTVRDEFNTVWYVDDREDPAGPLCKALDRVGFREIALPRRAILSGEVDPEFDTSSFGIALAGLRLIDRVDERVRRELIARAEHQARVFFCWRCLALDSSVNEAQDLNLVGVG